MSLLDCPKIQHDVVNLTAIVPMESSIIMACKIVQTSKQEQFFRDNKFICMQSLDFVLPARSDYALVMVQQV